MEKISELSAKEKLLTKVLETSQTLSRELTPESESAQAATTHQPSENVAKTTAASATKRTKSACSQQSCSESSGGVQSPATSPPVASPVVKPPVSQQGRESPMRSHVRAFLPHQQRTMVRNTNSHCEQVMYNLTVCVCACCYIPIVSLCWST